MGWDWKSKMNAKNETCVTCGFFAHGKLFESDLESFDTVDHCRRYPKHVGIADIENHWCGEYITDASLEGDAAFTTKEIAKRIQKSRESRERRRDRY